MVPGETRGLNGADAVQVPGFCLVVESSPSKANVRRSRAGGLLEREQGSFLGHSEEATKLVFAASNLKVQ